MSRLTHVRPRPDLAFWAHAYCRGDVYRPRKPNRRPSRPHDRLEPRHRARRIRSSFSSSASPSPSSPHSWALPRVCTMPWQPISLADSSRATRRLIMLSPGSGRRRRACGAIGWRRHSPSAGSCTTSSARPSFVFSACRSASRLEPLLTPQAFCWPLTHATVRLVVGPRHLIAAWAICAFSAATSQAVCVRPWLTWLI